MNETIAIRCDSENDFKRLLDYFRERDFKCNVPLYDSYYSEHKNNTHICIRPGLRRVFAKVYDVEQDIIVPASVFMLDRAVVHCCSKVEWVDVIDKLGHVGIKTDWTQHETYKCHYGYFGSCLLVVNGSLVGRGHRASYQERGEKFISAADFMSVAAERIRADSLIVHCPTLNEWQLMLKHCGKSGDDNGWIGGDAYLNVMETHVPLISYNSLDYYRVNGYRVIRASDYLSSQSATAESSKPMTLPQEKQEEQKKTVADEKFVIHCVTFENWRAILKYLEGQGAKWGRGELPLAQVNFWNSYREGTCLIVRSNNRLGFGVLNSLKDYEIISDVDYLKDKKPVDKSVIHCWTIDDYLKDKKPVDKSVIHCWTIEDWQRVLKHMVSQGAAWECGPKIVEHDAGWGNNNESTCLNIGCLSRVSFGNIQIYDSDKIISAPEYLKDKAVQPEKVVVHCRTNEEWSALLTHLQEQGARWWNRDTKLVDSFYLNLWGCSKESSCVNITQLDNLHHGDIKYYQRNGSKIIPAPEYLKNKVVSDKSLSGEKALPPEDKAICCQTMSEWNAVLNFLSAQGAKWCGPLVTDPMYMPCCINITRLEAVAHGSIQWYSSQKFKIIPGSDYLKGRKKAIHCPTLESFRTISVVHLGRTYPKDSEWDTFKQDTCLLVESPKTCGELSSYRAKGYDIISAADYLKSNPSIAVHCRTREEWKSVLNYLHAQGATWSSHSGYIDTWQGYQEEACIDVTRLNSLSHGRVEYYKVWEFKVISAADYLKGRKKAIHCSTPELFKSVESAIGRSSIAIATERSAWEVYKQDTCVPACSSELAMLGEFSSYQAKGYEIIEASDYLAGVSSVAIQCPLDSSDNESKPTEKAEPLHACEDNSASVVKPCPTLLPEASVAAVSDERIAVSCQTKQEWRRLLEFFEAKGEKWGDKSPLSYLGCWGILEKRTCLNLSSRPAFGDILFYVSAGYRVMPASRYKIEPETNTKKASIVHCKTRQEWKLLLKHLDNLGAKWSTGVPASDRVDNWNLYKQDTCLNCTNLDVLTYAFLDSYKEQGVEIISAGDFLKDKADFSASGRPSVEKKEFSPQAPFNLDTAPDPVFKTTSKYEVETSKFAVQFYTWSDNLSVLRKMGWGWLDMMRFLFAGVLGRKDCAARSENSLIFNDAPGFKQQGYKVVSAEEYLKAPLIQAIVPDEPKAERSWSLFLIVAIISLALLTARQEINVMKLVEKSESKSR